MTRIKICGLTRREDVEAVNAARPDYCGFVLQVPGSRRNLTLSQAEALSRLLKPQILPVGVFVNASLPTIREAVDRGIIRAVQLHGQETEDFVRQLQRQVDVPLFQAFSIRTEADVERARRSPADVLVLDHGAGGTGQAFDWSLIAGRLQRPFFLAGGLGPDNVAKALAQVHPWAVDMSSGVETNGKKDPTKMMAAVAAVRSFDR